MMKFVFKQYNRNTPPLDFIKDIRAVCKKLGLKTITIEQYDKFGAYGSSAIRRRFNGWNNALIKSGLSASQNREISKDEIIKDIIRVSKKIKKNIVTTIDYDIHGKYSVSAVNSKFGSWFDAIDSARLTRSRILNITNLELFDNLKKIWIKLRRQPTSSDIEKTISKYCAGVYSKRFGSWSEAIAAFKSHIQSDKKSAIVSVEPAIPVKKEKSKSKIFKHKTKRSISLRLRFLILKRDRFKCSSCGKSPSTDSDVVLHVDHKKPWSKGGETVYENLQSLCSDCNVGKFNII